MLCELFIENLAVIKEVSIQFNNGLNVFTGETGAGKSIVIDAINTVLGQRTSRDIVRHGEKKASVIATFRNIPLKVKEILSSYGYDAGEDELIISREISADSKSSARIMGKPATVSILREIGRELINIHGQHDNQILLSPEVHIDILDKYGDFPSLLSEYHECYKNVVKIKREMKKISMDENEKARKIDLLKYQIDEIEKADLSVGIDVEIEEKRKKIRESAKIISELKSAHAYLYGREGEGGAVDLSNMAAKSLEHTFEVFPEAEAVYSKLDGLSSELEAITDSIGDLIEELNFDKSYMEEVDERYNDINTLKMKYGGSVEAVLEYLEKASSELSTLELSTKRLEELNALGNAEFKRLLSLAEQLSAERKKAAERFVGSMTEELSFLDMPNVRLEVSLEKVKPNSKGQDGVEFLISTNKGEPPKSISKIASGGELSRIMLAIKNTLADKDEIQTMIFDEIDTGVSGRAAQKIGLKLKEASKNRQILTVTHLAQIAALADYHYLIKKQSDEENTYTTVTPLDMTGRIGEVARIMSTDKITDLMLKTAEDMIKRGEEN